jgi:hypothetical protein
MVSKPVLTMMHRLENTDACGVVLMSHDCVRCIDTTSVVASQCGTSACAFLPHLFRSLTLLNKLCASLVLCGSKTTAVACSKVSGQEIDCVNEINGDNTAAMAMCGARNNCFCNKPYAYVTIPAPATGIDISGCYRKFSHFLCSFKVLFLLLHKCTAI